MYVRSDNFWNVGKPVPQPIPFRHDLHVSAIGIDCVFCHSTATRAASAGMPTAHTCLTCHSQILQGASVLEPLRTSAGLQRPISWASVHRLPAFIFFHHGAHASSGIGCETCHGDVGQMRQTQKVHTLSMAWCLDCHRNPPVHTARDSGQPPLSDAARNQPGSARSLEVSRVFATALTDCSVCHR